MYEFKNLPRASKAQFQLPPRDRIIPEGQIPGEPKALDLDDAERLREKRSEKAAMHDRGTHRNFSKTNPRRHKDQSSSSDKGNNESKDPWAKWR